MDEEEEKESNPGLAKPSNSNMTIMLPDMEDFERMAKTSSTPFTGGLLELCLGSVLWGLVFLRLGGHASIINRCD